MIQSCTEGRCVKQFPIDPKDPDATLTDVEDHLQSYHKFSAAEAAAKIARLEDD